MSTVLQSIIRADIQNASGHPSKKPGLVEQFCFYTSSQYNIHKAHFIEKTSEQPHEVIKLRVQVLKGEFAQVEKSMERLDQIEDSEEKAEYLLGATQTHCHQGRWREAVYTAEQGLRLQPVTITMISLLQCRSLALYELGCFREALFDCEGVLSQKDIYPQAVAVRYADALKEKILLSLGEVERVQLNFERHWDKVSEENLDLDNLLTLLRFQIDLNRSLGEKTRSLAMACRELADQIGDPLYKALAEVDLFLTFNEPPQWLVQSLEEARSKFQKVDQLLKMIESQKPEHTSEKRMLKTKVESYYELSNKPVHFVFIGHLGVVINLQSRELTRLSNRTNWNLFCSIVEHGVVERKLFFESLWQQKFSYEIHDGVVRAFLHRLRKKTGISIDSHTGKIHFPNVTFVSSLVP